MQYDVFRHSLSAILRASMDVHTVRILLQSVLVFRVNGGIFRDYPDRAECSIGLVQMTFWHIASLCRLTSNVNGRKMLRILCS